MQLVITNDECLITVKNFKRSHSSSIKNSDFITRLGASLLAMSIVWSKSICTRLIFSLYILFSLAYHQNILSVVMKIESQLKQSVDTHDHTKYTAMKVNTAGGYKNVRKRQ